MDVDGFHKPHQINRERKIQTEKKWKSKNENLESILSIIK